MTDFPRKRDANSSSEPSSPGPSSSGGRGRKAVRVEPSTILDAALQVFGEQGVSRASVRAIAQQAGCDPALIYYHFKNKEGIFEALLDQLFGEVNQRVGAFLQATAGQPTQVRLQQLMGAMANLLQLKGRTLPGIIRGEVVRGAEGSGPAVAQRLRPLIALIAGIFQEGIDRGELRPDLSIPIMPFFFMRPLVEIVELMPVMGPHLLGKTSEQALEHALQAWFELFWRGIALDPVGSTR